MTFPSIKRPPTYFHTPSFWFVLAMMAYVLVYHAVGYFGHYGYDDMRYAELAKQMADGRFSLQNGDHFSYRWALLVPTAISYKLFGVNDISSAIPAWLCTFFTMGLMWYICQFPKIWDGKLGANISRQTITLLSILATALYILSYGTLFYADKIMTDIYVAFAAFAAIVILFHQKYISPSTASFRHSLLFAVMLFIGFLAKETIIFFLPVFGVLFLLDIWQRKNVQFWIYSAAIGFGILVLYFGLVYLQTHSFLHRFEAIAANSYFNPCSYDQLPFEVLFKRITYELLFVLIRFSSVSILFFMVAIFSTPFKKLLHTPDAYSFFCSVSLLAFLSSYFMTTSPTSYVPMCPDFRHFLYLSPLFAIVAAPIVYQYFEERKKRHWVLILTLSFAFLTYYGVYENYYYTYLPFAILVLIRYFLPIISSAQIGRFLTIAFIAMLFLQPIQSIQYAGEVDYETQKELIYKRFKDTSDKNLVITNTVQSNYGNYYLQFEENANTRFVNYKDFQPSDIDSTANIFVLTNGLTRYQSGVKWEDLPPYIQQIPDSFKKVFEENGVVLYEVPYAIMANQN
ncbi:MAG: hypothetical protein R3E32_12085 [Chitinophagales bacterium]